MNIDHVLQRHLAHGNVHLHLGKGAAEGVGIVLDGVSTLGRNMLGMYRVILGRHGQLAEAHQYFAVSHANNVAIHNIHVVRRLTGQFLRIGKNLFFQQQPCLADGEACHIGLTAGIGAQTGGRNVRILAGHHMHILIALETQYVGCHLGVSGIGALADLRFAALHGDGTVQIQQHTVGTGFQGNGIYRRVVPECGHADTAADGAGILGILCHLAVIVDVLAACLQTLTEGVVVVDVVAEAVLISLRHNILHPEGQRIHPHRLGALVHIGLVGKGCLRHTVAAHGAGGGTVGEHRPCVALHIVTGIVLREGTHRLGHDRVAMGGVSALIGEALHLAGGKGTVLPQP